MAEEFARVGEIELCYETFGADTDPTVLLVMGLATQMIAWQEPFCEMLVDEGFRVVRFDNRDVGRSSRAKGRPPGLGQMLTRSPKGVPYLLSDMAADAVGLLDHLGVDRAHVVGASMGGMIAQTMAARRPDRVESLVSIMSNTGKRLAGQPAFSVYPVLLRSAPPDREGYIEAVVKTYSVIGSSSFERNEDDLRAIAGLAYDRGTDRAGVARQMGAITASGDRTDELRTIQVPTLVIHGTADKLVRPSGGKATQKAIPGARLVTIEGMGHDLPRQLWPRFVRLISDHASAAMREREVAA